MACVAKNSKTMLIYLLVGCFFQLGNVHTTPVPAGSQSTKPPTTPSKTASNVSDKTPINNVENVGEIFKSLIKNTRSTVSDFTSETNKSLEEIAQAGGRATLALGYLVSQLFDGISATVATGSGYLANGIRSIDDIVGDLPVVGMVTGTLDAVTSHVSNAVGEMSANGRKTRKSMFDGLREQLNRSSSRLSSTENSSTNST
ncbi:PREDICTED: uncharacterized protein LOC107171314 [Diuraphis noxia]|uniref:uncharacterized protein LOC107171314 n=1 Tax=Diuraphis noxia TaxID=143948 RepID=UPI000763AA7B|nr:PREDICTED: uncharacterized protein LOC107171314 [Diuraphis noxia]